MKILFSVLMILFISVSSFAMDVKLKWDANTESDLAGYKVYYGVGGLANPTVVDVGNVTTTTVTGLDARLVYSFAVKPYNTSDQEAVNFSNIAIVSSSNSNASGAGSFR